MDGVRELRRQTFRNMYRHGAISEAFAYVWQYRAEPNVILERLRDKEESLSQADASSSSITSMAPGASPRLYLEGFVEGLRVAVQVLGPAFSSCQYDLSNDLKLRPIVFRAILEAAAKSEAFRFAWSKVDSIEEIESWLHRLETGSPDLVLVKLNELRIETDMKERVSDEDELRKSMSFEEALRAYYRAYLSTLRDATAIASELGIETIKQGV